ncbi:MAG: binding-protein-dependent transport system inner rane component [Firmicutes bacterium]|nr:binding-protein-dependent transport system inner rane component [Bacillota bacterium]
MTALNASVKPQQADQAATPVLKERSHAQAVLHRLLRNKAAVAGGVVVILLVLVALLAPHLAPADPLLQDVPGRFKPPSAAHWLGTDELGRDILSRIIVGSRISLLSSIIAVSISLTVGVVVGLVAGFYAKLDNFLMRLIDIMMAFPGILLAIAIVSALGPGQFNVMIAVGIQVVPTYARITRSQVLSLRSLDYILAARSQGAGDTRIIFKHILPNCLATIIVYTTLNLASAILSASTLSFLGLGAPPPSPEWGGMVSTARQFFLNYPNVAVWPTLAIFVTVLAFNFLGDGLRDALDPRLKDV